MRASQWGHHSFMLHSNWSKTRAGSDIWYDNIYLHLHVHIRLIHLCGAMTIHVQEVEETSMLFVPAVLIRELHKLINGCPLELLISPLCAELKQEPACFQGMAWVSTGQHVERNQRKMENAEASNKEKEKSSTWASPWTHCARCHLFTWVLQSALATRQLCSLQWHIL